MTGSKDDEMSTPLWKKFGNKGRYRVDKEDRKEDKKYRKGWQREVGIDNRKKVQQRD